MSSPAAAPVKPRQLSPWPHFEADEIEAATAVLRSGKVNYWTGNECKDFEREYAAAVGATHAIAVSNGSLTLEMALRALGVGPGDDVIVTPRSFMASVSCVVMVGAHPVWADVDRDSGNLTAATIAAALTPQTKAVIPVHLGGWPCDMPAIMQLAEEKKFFVIEDCAQANGAMVGGKQIGAWGHISSFSFCQDKIITTGGEGGLITTNYPALWDRMWSLKEHGKSYDAAFRRQWPPGFRWLHESFGSNYRMTEMQAAIGRVALRRLPARLAIRQRHAVRYAAYLASFPAVRVPAMPEGTTHANYKFYCYVQPENLRPGWTRDRIMSAIATRGVPAFSGSCSEIYLEKAFDAPGLRPAHPLPVTKELGETSLMFLVHPTLTDDEVEWMCGEIAAVLTEASR